MINRRQLIGATGAIALSPFSSFGTTIATTPDASDPLYWSIPREITVNNLSTGERGTFLYHDKGEYVQDAYVALCRMLRDHRENKAVQLEPRLFDLIWANSEWYFRAQGKRPPYLSTSAYRTFRTNWVVGGSPGSRHPDGAAIDGRFAGFSVGQYSAMSRRWNAGGVGLYPNHVHTDIRPKPAYWVSKGVEI